MQPFLPPKGIREGLIDFMKKYEQDLCHGSLWKQIWSYSLPLMFSNILQVLFNMADIAVIGRYVGSNALGSVGSTSTLIYLFTGLLIGMAGGINVLVALYAGAKNAKELSETVHTASLVSLITGFLLTGAGILFARNMLEAMNTRSELLDGATLYFRLYFLGIPAMALYNFGNAVLSAIGDTKRPLYYLTIAGIINVILNLFFVLFCHMDVDGVALASVISQYISAFLIIRTLFLSHTDYGLYLSSLRFTPDKLKMILKIGIPSGMQNAIFSFANLFVQIGINSFDATMVAGNSAASNEDGIVYNLMAAFYTACSSFIGQNFGGRKKERILKSYLISLFYAFFIGLLFGAILLFFGREFLSLFTQDSAVIEAGMLRLTVMSISYPVSAFMDCTIAASRGLGKSVVPTILVILGSCVFRIVWIYTIFAYFKTITSLYLLFVCSWSITAAAEIVYFISIYRKQIKLIQN